MITPELQGTSSRNGMIGRRRCTVALAMLALTSCVINFALYLLHDRRDSSALLPSIEVPESEHEEARVASAVAPLFRQSPNTTRKELAPTPEPAAVPEPPELPAQLPRHVPCVELSAIESCLPPRSNRPAWPPSADLACIRRGATKINCSLFRDTSPTPPLSWASVAFGFPIFNSANEEELLKTAATTWLPIVRGADLLLTTDKDDPRTDGRIKQLVAADVPMPTSGDEYVHVHRCAVCCAGGHVPKGRSTRPAVEASKGATAGGATAGGAASGGGSYIGDGSACEGVQEAWRARSKVLHMLAEMGRRFSGDRAPRQKAWLIKLDADTLVHPHNLLPLLTDLGGLARSEPLLLGLAACRSEPLRDFCHAAGGAGSALSLRAVHAIRRFVEVSYGAEWLDHLDELTYGGEDVAVSLALKESTGAAVVNAGGFHQARPDEYLHQSVNADGIVWPRIRPVTFHNFKSAQAYRRLFECAMYGRTAPPVPRCFVPAAEALFRHNRCLDSAAAANESCVETPPSRLGVNAHSRDGARLSPRRKRPASTTTASIRKKPLPLPDGKPLGFAGHARRNPRRG